MPPRAARSSLLFDLFAASQQVRSLLSEALAGSGLRPDEYGVYSGVFEFGPISPTELAAVVGMAPTTLSNYINEMRQRGHLLESPNPIDKRSRMLTLAPAGLATQRRASAAFERAYRPFVGRIADPHAVKAALLTVEAAARDTRQGLADEPTRARRPCATADTIPSRAPESLRRSATKDLLT